MRACVRVCGGGGERAGRVALVRLLVEEMEGGGGDRETLQRTGAHHHAADFPHHKHIGPDPRAA